MIWLGLIQLISALVYCVLILMLWNERKKLRNERQEIFSHREGIWNQALNEAEEYLKGLTIEYGPHIPSPGPTPAELKGNEALRIAWEEFNVIYKLTTPPKMD